MKVIIRLSAERDIQEIFDWYQNIREGLGDDFLEDFQNQLRYFEKFPRSFRFGYKIFRITSLDRFPYLIYFRITREGIIIQKIGHAHRSRRKLRI